MSSSTQIAAPPLQSQLSAAELASKSTALIVDIRSTEERAGDLGFIPGSIHQPEEDLVEGLQRLLQRSQQRRDVVLVCLTGRRCHPWLEPIAKLGVRKVWWLSGGMLNWRSSGYPVVGVTPVAEDEKLELRSLSDFPRVVMSCFVAESIETQLNSGRDQFADHAALVQELFAPALAADRVSLPKLRHTLDQLADLARSMGHPLSHIASNLDVMRASLASFEGDAGS